MNQRKIPTFLGLLLVIGAVFLFSIAFERISPLLSRAHPSAEPQNITFTNITDTSFTATWTTQSPATGAVLIDGAGTGTAYDQRDESQPGEGASPVLGAYTQHSVIVRNLEPQKTYGVRILSNRTLYQEGLAPYNITTAPVISGDGTLLEPVYGTVAYEDGKPATGAIVYVEPEGGQVLSSIVTESGTWVIPLNMARTADLSAFLPQEERITETIIVRSDQGESIAITDTLNDNPVPSMTIGKEYDYRKIQAEAPPLPSPIAQATAPPPTVLGESTSPPSQNVAITQPVQGAHLTTNLPLFQGTGVIGNPVLVIVGIRSPQSGSVTVGADGIWRFTPARPLTDGKQSITVTTKDRSGTTIALTNTFEIFKSGTQVLGDATPSATIAPTETLSPTPGPTSAATPSPTITDLTGDPVPVTGSGLPTILLMFLGALFLVGGAAIFIW